MSDFQKSERSAWIQERMKERQILREQQDLEKQRAADQEKARLWSPFLRQVTRTNELNVAWKQDLEFFCWDQVVLLNELSALRVTGHELPKIPACVCGTLTNLQTLSLIANGIEQLPSEVYFANPLVSPSNSNEKSCDAPAE